MLFRSYSWTSEISAPLKKSIFTSWAEDEDSLEEDSCDALEDEDWASDEDEFCDDSDEVGSTADDVSTEKEDSGSSPEWHDERASVYELEDEIFADDNARDEDEYWAASDDDSRDSCTDEELKA